MHLVPGTAWFPLRFQLRGSRPAGSVPHGLRVYAIGDIHGRRDLLDRLLNIIAHDSAAQPSSTCLVFLGDYVDRGPDSKGVIDRLVGPLGPYETHFLRGNHDDAMVKFLENAAAFRAWKNIGGESTLASYGVMVTPYEDHAALEDMREAFASKLPPQHFQFLSGLEYFVQIGDYHFVHAGVRPGVPLNEQSVDDMLWIRDAFTSADSNFGRIIVHGHTPTHRPIRKRNRIGVDTGAWSSNRLTALVLESTSFRFIST